MLLLNALVCINIIYCTSTSAGSGMMRYNFTEIFSNKAIAAKCAEMIDNAPLEKKKKLLRYARNFNCNDFCFCHSNLLFDIIYINRGSPEARKCQTIDEVINNLKKLILEPDSIHICRTSEIILDRILDFLFLPKIENLDLLIRKH